MLNKITIILLIFIPIFSSQAFAQKPESEEFGNNNIAEVEDTLFGTQQVISTEAVNAQSVHAADIDGDGNVDVLSASASDNKIAWYENAGGNSFNGQQIITTNASGAEDVHAADIDGDDKTDVLSASRADNKIAWYKNEGGGSFGTQQVITTEANLARSVHAADLDNDDDIDVLSASSYDNKIAWYENTGNGSFSEQQVISTNANGAYSVYAEDLNGDGDADVVSGSYDDNKIAWYENTGGGSFGAQQVVSTDAEGVQSVHVADLNGDENVDVLSASTNDDKIAWYENTGGGSFSGQQVISINAAGARSVHTADINGDGNVDVLSASSGDIKIAWYENTGGSFGEQQVISTNNGYPISVGAAHINDDRNIDVISASNTDDKIAFYENMSNSDMSTTRDSLVAQSGPGMINLSWIAIDESDFTGYAVYRNNSSFSDTSEAQRLNTDLITDTTYTDRDVDIDSTYYYRVMAMDSPDNISLFSHQVSASPKVNFFLTSIVPRMAAPSKLLRIYGNGFHTPANRNTVHFSPANEERDIEVIPDSGTSAVLYAKMPELQGRAQVYITRDNSLDTVHYSSHITGLQSTSVTFGSQQVISAEADGARSVEVADLNNDSEVDVLSASYQSGELTWYKNQGGGFNSNRSIIHNEDEMQSVAAADMNNDGHIDVLSASTANDKIAWYENKGGGTFSSQKVISTNANGARDVVAADLNGDGYLDIVSASNTADKIAWYENQIDGSFGTEQIITTEADGALNLATSDLDNDGDLDILSASWNDNKIAWYENQDEGTIGSQQIISSNAEDAQSVSTADLDNDGDIDVISASSGDDKIAWYENLGDGDFNGVQNVISANARGAKSVATADMNGDGSIDVISGLGSDTIEWYMNKGEESFSNPKTISTDIEGVNEIIVNNLDGDGKVDILSASRLDDKIALYKNSINAPEGLRSSSEIGEVKIQWNRVNEENLAGYNVYRNENQLNDRTGNLITNSLIADTSYTDQSVKNGREYYYRVEAVDNTGYRSKLSDSIKVKVKLPISGKLTYAGSNDNYLKGPFSLMVRLQEGNQTESLEDTLTNSGEYQFGITPSNSITVKPQKPLDSLDYQALNISDVIKLQRILVGLDEAEDKILKKGGDINNDSKLDIRDADLLHRHIVGEKDTIPEVSWYLETQDGDSVYTQQITQDDTLISGMNFKGMVKGDLDKSWPEISEEYSYKRAVVQSSGKGNKENQVQEYILEPDRESSTVRLAAHPDKNIYGFQFDLVYNQSVSITKSKGPESGSFHYHTTKLDSNGKKRTRVAWYSLENPIEADWSHNLVNLNANFDKGKNAHKVVIRNLIMTNEYGRPTSVETLRMKAPFDINQRNEGLPDKTELQHAFPNPFNPQTTIRYTLAEPQQVRLEVYNMAGRRIQVLVDEQKEAGYYQVNFNGESLASGVYLYRLVTGNGTYQVRKFSLIK